MVFTAVFLYFLIAVVPYPEFIISAIIVVALGILAGIIDYRPFLVIVLLSLPFSLEVPLGLGDSKILVPSEVITIVLSIAVFVRLLFNNKIAKVFLVHPITMFVLLYAVVMVITSFTSSMNGVSFKFTGINLLYISVFYFLINQYVEKYPDKAKSLYMLYGIALFLVIGYELYNHSLHGFSKISANYSVRPFYSDHAIYSAALAMLFPAFAAFAFIGKKLHLSSLTRSLSLLILLGITMALVFSYSRAAWISVVVAGIFFICLLLKIKPKFLMLGLLVAGIFLYFNWDNLVLSWKQNKNNSTTNQTTIELQTKSITNISTDVSNAESCIEDDNFLAKSRSGASGRTCPGRRP